MLIIDKPNNDIYTGDKLVITPISDLVTTGSLAALSSGTMNFTVNYRSDQYTVIGAYPCCGNGWCKPTLAGIQSIDQKCGAVVQVYNGNSTSARTFDVCVIFILMPTKFVGSLT